MKFRKDYFDNFMLKASRYGEFNDPFDLVLGCYGSSLSEEDGEAFYNAMPEHYRDPVYHIETYLDIQAGARASVAVMCFTKTFKNILMWSHYAAEHTGICIGYDYNCDFFHGKYSCNYSNNVGKIRKVEYTLERPKYILPSDLVNDTNDWFKKSKDWRYEKEYRILLPISNSNNDDSHKSSVLLYRIDPKHIKKVILGCRMSEKNKEYIYKKLSGHDIQIIEAEPNPAHYLLNFEKYVPNNSRKNNIVYNLGMDV